MTSLGVKYIFKLQLYIYKLGFASLKEVIFYEVLFSKSFMSYTMGREQLMLIKWPLLTVVLLVTY